MLERREARDFVSIYFAAGQQWKIMNTFEVNEATDAAEVLWCRDDTALLVYDSSLESRFWVFSAMTGDCLSKINLPSSAPSQQLMGLSLGIKSISVSPNGLYIAVAMFEPKIRIFNGISMREVACFDHPT